MQAPAPQVPLLKRPEVIILGIFALVVIGILLWFMFDKVSSAPKAAADAAADPPRSLPPVIKAPCDPGCKCYSDVAQPKGPTPFGPGDVYYNNLQTKDNKTFCGFEKDGVRNACEPTCCTPACT